MDDFIACPFADVVTWMLVPDGEEINAHVSNWCGYNFTNFKAICGPSVPQVYLEIHVCQSGLARFKSSNLNH